MRRRWILLLWIGLLLWPATTSAADEPVSVDVRLNRVQITVGDILTYELLVTAPKDYTLEVPPVPERGATFGEWEVRACSASTPSSTDAAVQQGWTCELVNWKVGYHAFPTQIVRYTAPDGSTGRVTTVPLAVEIASVLDENAQDIKPIKPPLNMEEQANYLLILGLSLLTLLLLGFLVWAALYYRRHRPVPAPIEAAAPPPDPVATALAELERIARMNLVAQDRIVDHYALIADVLRRFIADRFSIPALERTTGEVRMAMNHPMLQQRRDILLALLAESDGVKFARRMPTSNEALALLENARQAVLATR